MDFVTSFQILDVGYDIISKVSNDGDSEQIMRPVITLDDSVDWGHIFLKANTCCYDCLFTWKSPTPFGTLRLCAMHCNARKVFILPFFLASGHNFMTVVTRESRKDYSTANCEQAKK